MGGLGLYLYRTIRVPQVEPAFLSRGVCLPHRLSLVWTNSTMTEDVGLSCPVYMLWEGQLYLLSLH